MKLSGAIERLERAVAVAGSPDAGPSELRNALSATTELQSFIAARRAELVRALDAHPTAFPEATIAETSGCSLGQATKETERAATLDAADAMADALSEGTITTGHVDALTRSGKRLGDDKAGLFDDDETIASQAAESSVAEFERWLKRREKQFDRTDPEERLASQRRAARVSHWVDQATGMWHLRGRLDPNTGKDLARLIDQTADRLRAGELPATAPTDPLERDQHVKALALVELLTGTAPAVRTGPPLVVVDASQTVTNADGQIGPVLDWGYPVELPPSILAELAGTADADVVVVANGVVLHAPGRLDLGRTSRIANRAQRRALAGLYSTCAVPGCTVHYDRCRLHHVTWWRNGGRTDLDNLLPVCQHHHTRLHEDGWEVSLGPNRELTIRTGDGQPIRAGPPKRGAA